MKPNTKRRGLIRSWIKPKAPFMTPPESQGKYHSVDTHNACTCNRILRGYTPHYNTSIWNCPLIDKDIIWVFPNASFGFSSLFHNLPLLPCIVGCHESQVLPSPSHPNSQIADRRECTSMDIDSTPLARENGCGQP